MLAIRQLRYLNANGVRTLCGAVQRTNAQIAGKTPQLYCESIKCSKFLTNTSHTLDVVCLNPVFMTVRHHYRNYQYHPNIFVRAYRKTRTWLTDHFVIAEKRFENIYSFLFLLTFGILGVTSLLLNLTYGGAGLDVDTTGSLEKIKD